MWRLCGSAFREKDIKLEASKIKLRKTKLLLQMINFTAEPAWFDIEEACHPILSNAIWNPEGWQPEGYNSQGPMHQLPHSPSLNSFYGLHQTCWPFPTVSFCEHMIANKKLALVSSIYFVIKTTLWLNKFSIGSSEIQ